MRHLYDGYSGEEIICVRRKDYFTDNDGYPNANAFDDFSSRIYTDDYRLICMNVDLRRVNAVNYTVSSYALRRVILAFQEYCCCFRIQGEKFNILVEEKYLDSVKELLDTPSRTHNSFCDIYYGIADEPYSHDRAAELIQKCVNLMYEDKAKKRNIYRHNRAVSGDKGNTPYELQETAERKYIQTMWHTDVHITVTEPDFKELDVIVYPTEYRNPLESITLIAVVDDMLNCRVFYGKNIQFGINGVIFTINARFDREGHLNTSVFHSGAGKCRTDVKTSEGVCIPANFGKRIGAGKEIYPVRKNIRGTCDYVLLDKGKAELVTSGILIKDGIKYGVYMDDTCIDLIPIEKY